MIQQKISFFSDAFLKKALANEKSIKELRRPVSSQKW